MPNEANRAAGPGNPESEALNAKGTQLAEVGLSNEPNSCGRPAISDWRRMPSVVDCVKRSQFDSHEGTKPRRMAVGVVGLGLCGPAALRETRCSGKWCAWHTRREEQRLMMPNEAKSRRVDCHVASLLAMTAVAGRGLCQTNPIRAGRPGFGIADWGFAAADAERGGLCQTKPICFGFRAGATLRPAHPDHQ